MCTQLFELNSTQQLQIAILHRRPCRRTRHHSNAYSACTLAYCAFIDHAIGVLPSWLDWVLSADCQSVDQHHFGRQRRRRHRPDHWQPQGRQHHRPYLVHMHPVASFHHRHRPTCLHVYGMLLQLHGFQEMISKPIRSSLARESKRAYLDRIPT